MTSINVPIAVTAAASGAVVHVGGVRREVLLAEEAKVHLAGVVRRRHDVSIARGIVASMHAFHALQEQRLARPLAIRS